MAAPAVQSSDAAWVGGECGRAGPQRKLSVPTDSLVFLVFSTGTYGIHWSGRGAWNHRGEGK